MTITLPKKPKGEDYEDLVAAYLIALGYFIEANLHLREGSVEVLELDVIATPPINPLTDTVLLDAKSGKSGFADVFKMFGWMRYLGIAKGCVVRTEAADADKLGAMETVTKATNVHIATLDLEAAKFELSCLDGAAMPLADNIRSALLSAGWYSRIAQRKCLRAFINFTKSMGSEIPEVKAATQYRWASEQALLAATPIKRAQQLYSAYSASPQVTGSLIKMLAKGDKTKEEEEWESVRDLPKRQELQYAMVMEHAARLGILKNALLHLLEKEAKAPADKPASPGVDLSAFVEWMTPESFRTGLTLLKAHPHRTRIPRLFQVFIEIFGGFYGMHNDRDIEALAVCSGIPKADVVSCLGLFDNFFPISTGWFFKTKNELCIMKMVPAVYRGAGAFFRGAMFEEEDYSKLYPNMGWLVRKWHNAIYHTLEPHLGTAVKDAK